MLLVLTAACSGPGGERADPRPSGTAEATPAPSDEVRSTEPGSWPDDSTTGVPDGVQLQPSPGLRITEAGTVIDAMDVDGCVVVAASDVVIKRSRISCEAGDGAVVQVEGDASNLLLEDVEIDGAGASNNGLGSRSFTLRRGDVHGSSDGVRAGSDTVVEDSWIHDLVRMPGSHNDAVQTVNGANIVIRGNRLQPYRSDTQDFMNAAYIFAPDVGAIGNIEFSGNLIDGGNYSIMGTADATARVTDNVFTRNHRYGPMRLDGDVATSGNRYLDGTPIP